MRLLRAILCICRLDTYSTTKNCHSQGNDIARDSEKSRHIASSLAKAFQYEGDETCATDGLCALACPVKIDCGKLIKQLRAEHAVKHRKMSLFLAGNMGFVTSFLRGSLSAISFFHSVLGTPVMGAIASGLRTVSLKRIPAWNPFIPTGAGRINISSKENQGSTRRLFIFPHASTVQWVFPVITAKKCSFPKE